MATLANRIGKLEGSFGADETERWLRSLSDEELDTAIARVDAQARHCLEVRGIACADMDIKDVLVRLEEIDSGGAR